MSRRSTGHLEFAPVAGAEARQLASAGSENMTTIFISRQPIYDRSGKMSGYQLLYDRDALTRALSAMDQKAGSEFFLNTVLKWGMEPLGNGTPAFIGITRTVLLQNYCTSLPKDRVVLEIPGDVEPDDAVIRFLTELRKAGYNIAFDDFDFTTETRRVLDVANYVKICFNRLRRAEITEQLSFLKQSKVKAIVTGIETHEALEIAKSLDFEYFAGPCFTKPKGKTSAEIATNRLTTMQLIMKLHDPELEIAELEAIVKQDLAISFKLMRYVNSALLSVGSIKTAIQQVGTDRLRSWASVLFLSKLDEKPTQLIVTALVRAKMAESLAQAMGEKHTDTYYMVGLFSLVDALLNVPMPEATQLLPFSGDVREALISLGGRCGAVLKCVLSYESGNWSDVSCGDLDTAAIRHSYMVSIAAAHQMLKITEN